MSIKTKPINARAKGKTGELQAAREITALTGIPLVRNLAQSRNGGVDLLAPPGTPLAAYGIEIKRAKAAPPHIMAAWWNQAVTQAEAAGLTPLLLWRVDRHPWRARLPLSALGGASPAPIDLLLSDLAGLLVEAAPEAGHGL